MGASLGLPFSPSESFLVVQTSSPRFSIPAHFSSSKQVSLNSSHSSAVLGTYEYSELGRSRPPRTPFQSPNPKSLKASGASQSQSSSPGASNDGLRQQKSTSSPCQDIGTTLLGLMLLLEPMPNQTKRFSTISTLGRISWRPPIRLAFQPP